MTEGAKIARADLTRLYRAQVELYSLEEQMKSPAARNANPDVIDLNDKYRPTVIAEQFMLLYNKQWGDAYEILTEKHTEKETITYLLKIVMTIYDQLKTISKAQTNEVVEVISAYAGLRKDTSYTKVTEFVNFQKLSDERKKNYLEALQGVREGLLRTLRSEIPECICKDSSPFIDESIRLCWLMCTREPPIFLQANMQKGDLIDDNLVRTFTKEGKTVDYVVWPVLFLYEDGPILNTGVVQAI